MLKMFDMIALVWEPTAVLTLLNAPPTPTTAVPRELTPSVVDAVVEPNLPTDCEAVLLLVPRYRRH
jgi:hypothetical protein